MQYHMDNLGSRAASNDPQLSSPAYLIDQSKRMIDSLWGRFGWFNLRPSTIYRDIFNVGAGLILLRFLWIVSWPFRLTRIALWAMPILVCAAAFAGAVRNFMNDPQPQARLMFPALAAFFLIMAFGLGARPRRERGGRANLKIAASAQLIFSMLVLSGLLAANYYNLFVLLKPAYASSHRQQRALMQRNLPQPWKIAAQLSGHSDKMRARQSFVAGPGLASIEVPVIVASGTGELRLKLISNGIAPGGTEVETAIAEASYPLAKLGRPDIAKERIGPLADSTWVAVETATDADLPAGTYWLDLVVEGSGEAWIWGAKDADAYSEGELIVGDEVETDLVFNLYSR